MSLLSDLPGAQAADPELQAQLARLAGLASGEAKEGDGQQGKGGGKDGAQDKDKDGAGGK